MGKRHAKVRARYLAGLALQIPEETAERRRQQEQAYSMIRTSLGKEGTYETPTGAASGAPGGAVAPGDADFFQKAAVGRAAGSLTYGAQHEALRGMTIDPKKVAAATIGSPEFRIASRLTAESEQLLKREGPLWEELNKSVTGGIIEGSAGFMAEQSEALRREFARGGAARNRARQGVQQMRTQEAANRTRQQNLWNSSLALNQWARDNARTQLEFNQGWASNVAGVRESFHSALDRAGELFVNSALPKAGMFTATAERLSQEIHAANRSKARRIYGIAIAAVSMFAGGMGMAGVGAIGRTIGSQMGQQLVGYGAGSLLRQSGLAGQEASAQFGSAAGKIGGILFGREEERTRGPVGRGGSIIT